ncbi:MAG: hypothetical protein PHW25_00490 [Zoogloea sp.]|uniref:hypothetical protein n=1 Tax=Zoogloea sp. TaxID=49181 RepID=UPI00262AC13A|nr:hypothetical protein [Zoogloea sp.]MDD3325546.1 hypothetical protein [Zoogloea sp.]
MPKSQYSSDVASATDLLRAATERAREEVSSLESNISQVMSAQAECSQSVSVDDAAALIARSIKDRLAPSRARLVKQARAAVHLGNHVSVKMVAAILGNGEPDFKMSQPRILEIVSKDLDPVELLAITLTDEQIDAFARNAAIEAGAVVGGSDLNTVKAEFERLGAELESLMRQRDEMKAAIGSVSTVSIPRFI